MPKSSKPRAPKLPTDGSFTGLDAKFARNIYATSKGRIRLEVLAADLAPVLAQSCSKRHVLDVGAGLGQVNQWFAERGAQIVHSDIAEDMVDAAKHEHAAKGLSHQYRYITAPLQELTEHIGDERFDVVLCHAVLEWLLEPEFAIQTLAKRLKPNGVMSLMFYNRNAKLFANTVYGNFDYVQSDLQVKKTVRLSPQQPLDPELVSLWCQQAGLTLQSQSGVRCFHDYLRDPKRDQDARQLIDLELAYRRQSPFRELGRYQHWLFTRT